MGWRAKNVSYVFFSPKPLNENAGQLFQAISGTFPSTVQQLMPVGTTAGGEVNGDWLSIQAVPGKVQLDIASPSSAVAPFELPTIADIRSAAARALPFAEKAAVGRDVTRIGFVIDGVEFVSSYKEARARMMTALPFLDVPDDAHEIVFQLNSPLTLGAVDDVRLNRHCRWSSIVHQLIQLDMIGAAGAPASEEVHAAALLIDINTDPRFSGPFASKEIARLCEALASVALEVLDKGYDALR
jgi:hypothetical protein